MTYFKNGALLASAAALLAISACAPGNDSPAKDAAGQSPAAATVNGRAISQHVLDVIVEQGAASGRPDTPETRAAIIDQLVLQMLIADEAVKKGLDKSPEFIEQADLIRQSALASAYVQDFIKNNPVSDEALQAEYDRIKATITGNEYKARHILVEQEAEAKAIIAKLQKDAGAFAKLAEEKSKDPGSAANGGDLGWFELGRMVPEFSAALSGLEKGKFTLEPVKSQFGYHVILLEDVRPIEAPPLEEVKPQLEQQLQEQNLQKQFEALKAGAKIEISGAAAADTAETAEPVEADKTAAN